MIVVPRINKKGKEKNQVRRKEQENKGLNIYGILQHGTILDVRYATSLQKGGCINNSQHLRSRREMLDETRKYTQMNREGQEEVVPFF